MAKYIDAEKLPNAIGKALNKLDEEISPLVLTEVCITVGRAIKEAPTADVVEVKHGHWIKRGNEKKCSVCSFIYYSNNDDWNGCPNCLAKMGGDKNK